MKVLAIVLIFSYFAFANDAVFMPIPPPNPEAERPITGYQPVEKLRTPDIPPYTPNEQPIDTPDMDNITVKEPTIYMEEITPKVDEPLISEPLPDEERLAREPLVPEPNIAEPKSTEPMIQTPNVPDDLPVPTMGEPFIPEPKEPRI